jgi:hypothetical protein
MLMVMAMLLNVSIIIDNNCQFTRVHITLAHNIPPIIDELRNVIRSLISSSTKLSTLDYHTAQEMVWRQSPMLEGVPLQHCYTTLANVMAARIVHQADSDNDNQISFQVIHCPNP